MIDKRIECGCHVDCTTEPHECAKPCRWPSCLTEAEHRELVDEVMRDEMWGRFDDGGIWAVMCSECSVLGGHDEDCPFGRC